MQEPEDHRQFSILTHRVRNAHPCIQAGECSTDQGNDNGSRQYCRKGSSITTQQLVAYDLCHFTNRRP